MCVADGEGRNSVWRAEQGHDLTAWDAFRVAVFIQFAGPGLREEIFRDMKAAARPGGLIFLNRYTPEQLAFGTGGAIFRGKSLYDRSATVLR